MKLASLFDGISGFPLAGSRYGIKPAWASEIEKFPTFVSQHHFPEMIQHGDITKIDGAGVEPVDILTFGSPCQDLSVAGKRAGMQHADKGDEETTRSGLQKGSGQLLEPSWEMVGVLPGESWTPNTGESPNAAAASSLSQILEANPPAKYYLSEKACAGILRRAETRGKELPKVLRDALVRQCLA